jgi:hypothetical protein
MGNFQSLPLQNNFYFASSCQKISGENDGSLWCPFFISQVIGYENVRWVSHKILLVWSVPELRIYRKFSFITAPALNGGGQL